ncbi:MAG: type II secretion system protein J [Flavobacteriaceae bacterium]
MNRLQKIKAFTLSEMLVVLLITTIIVGMAFAVLNLVQRQMQGIQGNYETNTQLNLLRQSLWTDFHRFENVRYHDEHSTLHFSNELGHRTYVFEEDLIIKEQDTFKIKREYLKLYFENRAQSSGIIDALELKTTKASGKQEIFVFKQNTANIYMNL